MFWSACPALAGSVEPLHEAQADRGAKRRFDLIASKVNFDRLKDRRNKTTFGTFRAWKVQENEMFYVGISEINFPNSSINLNYKTQNYDKKTKIKT